MGWRPPRASNHIGELTAGATERVMVSPDDGKSGSLYERLVIDGRRYFLKTVTYESDWLMRITGDTTHRTWRIWTDGLMSGGPSSIDNTVVAMALEGTGPTAVLAQLMNDVAEHLVPEGDDLLSDAQHAGFLDAMADLSVTYWGWSDTIGLCPFSHRPRFFAPENIEAELSQEDVPGPIAAADQGWARLRDRAAGLNRVCRFVHADVAPLGAAIGRTPATFLHGDWKAGNLGRHPDGRTILLDWAYPGRGPACWDLGWYLALNAARLPESKDDAIDRFRRAIETRGVDTDGWWDVQLDLSLVAIMACFGWEKALGSDDELGWWVERVDRGVHHVDELSALM